MSIFAPQITRIKGLSDRRRLPRLNKIRLGFKLRNSKGVEFPAELPFFLLPDDVARDYGFKDAATAVERAKVLKVTRGDVLKFIGENYRRLSESLEIMFPINDIGTVFPQAYKRYGSSQGVKCMGDGEKAFAYNEEKKGMIEIPCPCEHFKSEANPKGECTQRGHLLVLVPKVSMGGVYQIDLGSYNSIIDINSGIDYVTALIGRFALVLLTLRRIPIETHHDNKKQVHYSLQLISNFSADMINQLRNDTQRVISTMQYLLPPPDDTNPVMDTGGAVMAVDEEEFTEVTHKDMGGTPGIDTTGSSSAIIDAIEGTGVIDVMPAEVITEASEDIKIPLANTLRDSIASVENMAKLKEIWDETIIHSVKLSKQEIKELNLFKNAKKAELSVKEPKSGINVTDAIKCLKKAVSLDELDHLFYEAIENLIGEDKSRFIKARDLKAVELKEPPLEITEKVTY